MLDLTRWHNWIAFGLLLLLWGVVFHWIANRFTAVQPVVKAAFGN